MQRSVRPKSAKGKTRPTPPPHPKPQGSVSSSGSSIRTPSRGHGTSSYRLRQSGRIATDSSSSNTTFQERHTQSEKLESKDESHQLDVEQFPEVARPVSSLSKYRILPRIPSTPDRGDARYSSPAGSELELDLMSSFAQQMILDSTRPNNPLQNSGEAKSTALTVAPKRTVANNNMRRQNENHYQDSPEHKKFRSSGTKSVFPPHTTRQAPGNSIKAKTKFTPSQEPKEGEPRLKLALKLPDGKRVERYFTPGSTISDVLHFAQNKMRIPIGQCDVYLMLQVPKVLIQNWKKTLQQLNISDRTVLYIEEKD